jgi:putative SOS response-associated peptidase YedK
MCGQFDSLAQLAFLQELLGVKPSIPPVLPRRVAPSAGAAIVVENPESRAFEVMSARFGLVPSWYRGALKDWKAATFNARVEDAHIKPAFKGAWRYRHALIPAEAFYEWSGPKTDRRRYRVTRADNSPLMLAGVWEEAYLAEGELWSFAVLTRPAGPDMTRIHDREPVILSPQSWAPWLRREAVDLGQSAPLGVSEETLGSLL